MKKLYIIFVLTCIVSINCLATLPTNVWSRIWGSSEFDKGKDVAVDNSSNVYVAGYTRGSFDGQSHNYGTPDLCLTKYNNSGTKQWTRIWGSSTSESGRGVSVDNAENVYVVGTTADSFDGQSNNGHYDLCLTKFNSSGTKQWTRIWGSSTQDSGRGVSVDNAGNIYVTGYAGGSFDGQINNGISDLFLTKYNSSGTKQWTRIWGSSTSDSGKDISIDSENNVYVAGYTTGSFDGQSNTSEGTNDLCLTKYNSNGTKQWTRIWGSSLADNGYGVCVNSVGKCYVTGYTEGSFDGQTNNGDYDLCLTEKVAYFYLDITNDNSVVSSNIKEIKVAGILSGIGEMWVSNCANNEVQFFDEANQFITPNILLEFCTNNIIVCGKTNQNGNFISDNIIIFRGLSNELGLLTPIYGYRTNALTLDFNVWFGSDILPDQRFLSTNSGASWFYYTNSLTFPSEGTYFWTAKGLDSSYNPHYAAATNKLIITTTLPKISLLSPADNTILTNNFAIDLMANFGSSSFARQLSTNSGVSWFDYEPGVPVYFPGVGVWNWTARGRNAAGWTAHRNHGHWK